jgi:DNA (cytosine-5)-methyltransferase 1
MRYIDLFCGMGAFRLATENVFRRRSIQGHCVFSSDIDPDARAIYKANFGEEPAGDIYQVETAQIPDYDLLLAGFPCQPFSIMGMMQGFEDTRGTLFFEIARILEQKRPQVLVLENVKQLVGHNNGRTLRRILETLQFLGYHTEYKVLNALDFGLPQKRERVFIVGFRVPVNFTWSRKKVAMLPLENILEEDVPEFYYASEMIKNNRLAKRAKINSHRTIWHENKGGHISAYPFSCALRAGASYNYLLVDGERRLTEREMLRLQGFPESYQIVGGYNAMRKLTGNSMAIPVVEAVIEAVLGALEKKEMPFVQAPMFELTTV